MKNQIRRLIALQKAESAVMRIEQRKKTLPEQLLGLDEDFKAVQAGVEADRRTFDELNRKRGEYEERLRKGQENLRKAKDRLSEVKTNKEYQSMLKEIEGIDVRNGEMEDEVLVLLERMDQLKVVLQAREREFEVCRREYEAQKSRIEEELKSLDDEWSVRRQDSLDLRKQVPSDIIKRYDSIKNIRNGLAVAPAWKEVCQGCHMNIPPQMYIELQRDAEIKYCPQCNRIIYWEDRSKEVSE